MLARAVLKQQRSTSLTRYAFHDVALKCMLTYCCLLSPARCFILDNQLNSIIGQIERRQFRKLSNVRSIDTDTKTWRFHRRYTKVYVYPPWYTKGQMLYMGIRIESASNLCNLLENILSRYGIRQIRVGFTLIWSRYVILNYSLLKMTSFFTFETAYENENLLEFFNT